MTRYTYHPPLYAGFLSRRNRTAEAIADKIPAEMLNLKKGRVVADVILAFGVGYHTARDAVRIAFAKAEEDREFARFYIAREARKRGC